MSSSTPKTLINDRADSRKSQSYPGTPRSMRSKVSVNLNGIFNEIEDDVTITPAEYSTAYQTALEPSELTGLSSSSHQSDINSIRDIEILRSQINSALNPYSTEVSPGGLSDTSSVDTMVLLRTALPQSSPELQLDENGVLLTSMSNLKNLYPGHSPSNILDSSLAAENTILKENIDKERLRRKHCEEQIRDLQQKLLESQEQLAVMVSTDRKRQIMIEQLDRTLATIVEGWKKKEANQIAEINRLKEEKYVLESTKDRQEDLLSNFEGELAEAVETITEEQNKVKTLDQKYQKQLSEYEEKMVELRREYGELQNENLRFEEEKQKILTENERCKNENTESLTNMEAQVLQLKEGKLLLEEQMKKNQAQFQAAYKELEKHVHETEKENKELITKLDTDEKQIKQLQTSLEDTIKEKDALSMEVSLLNSKFEALKTKQDSEMRLQLESEFNEQIHEIQKQISITESELRSSQKKQIGELMKRQKEEIEKYCILYQQELKKKEEQIRKLRTEHEKDLQKANEQISTLSASGQQLERQRSDLMNRMKMMMQQHWDETVSLLSNGNKQAYVEHIASEPFSSTLQSFQHSQQSDYQPTSYHPPISGQAPQYGQYTQPMYPAYVPPQYPHRSNEPLHHHPQREEPTRPRTSSPVSINHHSISSTATANTQSFTENQRKETRSSHEAISLLYQDLDDPNAEDHYKFSNQSKDLLAVSMETSTRSSKSDKDLTHFIEKLLQRSPGQPLDEVPVRDVSEERVPASISKEVDHLLQMETPKKQPITTKPAFKKSVVRPQVNKNQPQETLKDALSQSKLSEVQIVNLLKNLLDKNTENSLDTSGSLPPEYRPIDQRKTQNREKLMKKSDLKPSSVSKKSTKATRSSSNKTHSTKESQKCKPNRNSSTAWK